MRRPRWHETSFRSQIVLLTVTVTALGLVLVTVGIHLLLHWAISRNVDLGLEDRADSVVAAVRSAPGGGFDLPGTALDPGVVVLDADGRLVAGTVPAEVGDQVGKLSGVTRPRTLDVGERYRLHAVPFTTRSGVRGVVVVAEALEPYEKVEGYALLASVLVGLVVIVAVGAIARWVTARALAPVSRMAERATDWSEHDLGRRFELGPPNNEISALGATLDHLLERVAMTIRAEQRLTSELAHELRTPLAAIQGTADLALLRGGLPDEARVDLEQIAASSRAMAATIATLLDLARDPDAGDEAATSLLGDVVDAVTGLVTEPLALRCAVTPHADVRLSAPRELAVRALAPLVENAVRHARTRVSLSARVSAGAVELLVEDDGPGIDPSIRDRLWTPGASGSGDGTGLGLGIARRVARSIGGEVSVGDPGDGAAVFVLRLPRF